MNLTEAILFGSVSDVERELDTGVDLEEVDEYGFTPLVEAAISNRVEIADLLLRKGANVNNRDTTGRTALHWAVDNHNLPLSRLLLNAEADPNAYTYHGQPILVLPLLRQQTELKQLLYDHKAQLGFAQDFIQVKLLGHRYELSGQADIINPHGEFIAVDYEGFFLEFVLDIIHYSLQRYRSHFAARAFRDAFEKWDVVIQLFQQASQLLQYQKYTIDIDQVASQVDPLLKQEMLLLPLAYEGHAVSFIKYKDLLVRCDRGENSQREGSIVIYQITRLEQWTLPFVKQLLYQKQSEFFITEGIHSFLGLKTLMQLPIASQLVGNCSWANMEASVLAILYLLQFKRGDRFNETLYQTCLSIYDSWLQWDKARALEECIQNFEYATPARKATIAMMLGAVFFQQCRYQNPDELETAKKLLSILMVSDYQYILKGYLKVYWKDRKTPEGHNLVQLLANCGVSL